jgi:hypothetical protein
VVVLADKEIGKNQKENIMEDQDKLMNYSVDLSSLLVQSILKVTACRSCYISGSQ